MVFVTFPGRSFVSIGTIYGFQSSIMGLTMQEYLGIVEEWRKNDGNERKLFSEADITSLWCRKTDNINAQLYLRFYVSTLRDRRLKSAQELLNLAVGLLLIDPSEFQLAEGAEDVTNVHTVVNLGLSVPRERHKWLRDVSEGTNTCQVYHVLLLFLSRLTEGSEARLVVSEDNMWRICMFSVPHLPWVLNSRTAGLCRGVIERIFHNNEELTQKLLNKVLTLGRKIHENRKLTTIGRLKAYPEMSGPKLGFETEDSEEWKSHSFEIIPYTYTAVVVVPSKKFLEKWHFIVPSCINLIEDYECMVKFYGTEILLLGLQEGKISYENLRLTGLLPLFWDLIMKNLSYVPSLTPEAESVLILDVSISVLVLVARLDCSEEKEDSKRMYAQYKKLSPVVESCIHTLKLRSVENVELAELLLRKLSSELIDELGWYINAFLSQILECVKAVAQDPFLTSDGKLLFTALRTIRELLLTCWDRLFGKDAYIYDILLLLQIFEYQAKTCEQEGKQELRESLERDLGQIRRILKEIKQNWALENPQEFLEQINAFNDYINSSQHSQSPHSSNYRAVR